MNPQKPTPPQNITLSRRDRIHALLFAGAALEAPRLTLGAAADLELPPYGTSEHSQQAPSHTASDPQRDIALNPQKPTPPLDVKPSRRDRIHALLFAGAALGTTLLALGAAAVDPKLPPFRGD